MIQERTLRKITDNWIKRKNKTQKTLGIRKSGSFSLLYSFVPFAKHLASSVPALIMQLKDLNAFFFPKVASCYKTQEFSEVTPGRSES